MHVDFTIQVTILWDSWQHPLGVYLVSLPTFQMSLSTLIALLGTVAFLRIPVTASSGDGIKHTKIARIISRNDPGLTLRTKCYVRVLGTTFILKVSPFIYFFVLG